MTTSDVSTCDVAVVGAGHNALVAACYLAQAGLEVEILERDTVLGGAVSTVERWPGYRVDRGSSLHVMVRHTPIVEELELGECGLRYLDADPWAYAPAPGPDEPGLVFAADLDRTCESIAAACGAADAAAYRALIAEFTPACRRILDVLAGPPTPGRVARKVATMGRARGGGETSRWFLQPTNHLLDATFRSERLRAALAWLASQSGPPPHEPGTVGHLSWIALMHLRAPGRPIGGSGELSRALAQRLSRLGGHIRAGDAATAFTIGGGAVTGVRTAAGHTVRARAVLSGAHVLTTLDLLAAAGAEPAGVRGRIRVGDGVGAAIRLATEALPAYPGAPADALHGMQLLVSDRAELRAAYADFLAARAPERPAVLALTPTAQDPSLAPPGHHTVTLWAQWHRYDLAAHGWDDLRKLTGESAIARLEAAAPGFAAGVLDTHVQTPLDLERELGLRRGNVMHLEMALDSMFALRPVPELSGYRGPLPGLYLTGASTHPGGGVFGASGRSAAKILAKDLLRGRRNRK
ncbi:MAG TPA: NAD(P)/FAD-dependent oxidoreductase [Sporichthya sp.]|nr:NAD(P)/FAD-dependent oxidoreductase [Sporichthya sp.]